MTKLLTFELSADSTRIDIHGSKEGLRQLAKTIEAVLDRGGHEHLMTPSWAGDELSEERQGEDSRLIHSVTVHCWED